MSVPTPGAPTAAAIGKGTTLGYAAAGASPTFVIIAELLELKPPKHTNSPVEVQRYDSPSLFPELVTGWSKGGEVEFIAVYNAAQGAALYALFGVPAQFQITKPDAKTWTYQAIITEFGDELPLKDKMTNTVKFAISGVPVATAASA